MVSYYVGFGEPPHPNVDNRTIFIIAEDTDIALILDVTEYFPPC